MKKILAFIFLALVTVSCYDDYVRDYDYNAVYFPFQTNVRTLVVGEGMKIQIGVALAGVMENKIDRTVGFEVNDALVTPAMLTLMKTSSLSYIKDAVKTVSTLLPLPSGYYTLSDSKMVIKPGQHMGSVILKADSASFLADPKTLTANYAIPLNITNADADSILQPRRFTVIGLKYENMLFGNYWHGGSALVNRPGKSDTTLTYYTTIPQPDAKVWALRTIGPDLLGANGYYNMVSPGVDEMRLTLSGSDITISSAAGSTYTILPDGTCTFNRAKLLQDRKIFIKYKYVDAGGNTYHATDTLTFRNRIRDGVNEWQDENPSHYTR